MPDRLPDVHFGSVEEEPEDWRETPTDDDDDDEVLAETPPDVIQLLGFDPAQPSHYQWSEEEQAHIMSLIAGRK